MATADQKMHMTAQLLNSLLPSNEAAFIIDDGGVLTDSGSFAPEIEKLVESLEAHPHPPAAFISSRMIPQRYRANYPEIAFMAVKGFDRQTSSDLTSSLLKRRNISVSSDDIESLVDLSEQHPFNIYKIVEEVSELGVMSFLANPSEFIEWKHRQTSEYISKIDINKDDAVVLALLTSVPELDLTSISGALGVESAALADQLQRLVLLHVVESDADRFRVSPALRVAVERDARITMAPSLRSDATKWIAKSLSLRIEDGTAPVTLVDSAVLASIESGSVLTELASAFLLPSHYVWLAKTRYDQRQWAESIHFGLEALKGDARLSANGLIATCRFLCLAAARTGDDAVFAKAITKLQGRANNDWARSNLAYLKGFQLRMKGRLPAAQDLFQEACNYHSGNNSAMRELAAIALARGALDQAERLAREAYSFARTNPYLVDMLLAVLVKKRGATRRDGEIEDLFAVLEAVGEENGRSFYTTRRAEYEYLWGDNKLATTLIEKAVAKTPMIFEVRRIQAEIYLKAGNKNRAFDAVQAMERMMSDHNIYDRRSNYRLYLETKAHYLTEIGQYGEAKGLFGDLSYFTNEEREAAIKDIEMAQGFTQQKKR